MTFDTHEWYAFTLPVILGSYTDTGVLCKLLGWLCTGEKSPKTMKSFDIVIYHVV